VFPHYRSIGDPDQLEEERRLAYVGITRARERLYLTHAWSRTLWGSTSFNPPSRFLSEIPADLLRMKEAQHGDGRTEHPGIARHEPVSVGPGDTVFHEKWGEGVVLSISGSGSDTQARVAFEDVGEKQLILAYAPLQKR
jgi:DNA helicase-2/ATP-dependent DNA helicase PcrA